MTALPTSIPCGSCGASTALSWETNPDISIGMGSCPSCSRSVLSLIGDSIDMAALDRVLKLNRQARSGHFPERRL